MEKVSEIFVVFLVFIVAIGILIFRLKFGINIFVKNVLVWI
jgi:hypothetical protein